MEVPRRALTELNMAVEKNLQGKLGLVSTDGKNSLIVNPLVEEFAPDQEIVIKQKKPGFNINEIFSRGELEKRDIPNED